MRKIIKYKLLATALAAVLTAPAYAAGGYYVGVSGGEADAKDACDGLGGTGISCDDTDTGWKIFGGYQFTQNWGVEAFYADLGESTAKGTVLGLPFSADAEIDGFGASAVGTWPLSDKFSVFGKVGFFAWDLEISGALGGIPASVDDDGTDLTYGLGARYSFNERLAVQVEWERFDEVGDDSTTGESDVDFLSAGIVLSF